jgi:glycosyltransferase involved in cell wall biosynthesis
MTALAVHVDQLFYQAPGGIGTYIRELVPALARADQTIDITLFHASFPGRRPEPWMETFSTVELPGSIRRLYPWWDLLGRPPLPEPLSDADILHAPSPATVPPGGRGQRLVVTVHDLAFRIYPTLFPAAWRLLFRAGTRRAARHADAVIAVSEHTAGDLVRFYGADPGRIHVVPLAASLPTTTTDPVPVLERMRIQAPYVLFVGTLEPRKNLIRLVRAYRRAVTVGDLPHRLVLAGPLGWHHHRLLAEIRAGGPGEVVLTGKTAPDDLDALYRGADLFVYPSLYEGFGLPVLEAMARGVPVLCSNASSLPEVAGDAAVKLDPRSVAGLTSALGLLLADEGERRRLSAAGLERAGRFSWEQTARGTLKVYESLG